MKMYICIKESTAVGMAMNSAAHGSLMCHLKYSGTENYDRWLSHSFKKVTCAVTEAEFSMLKSLDDIIIVTESRLNNAEVAIVVSPRPDVDYPEFISLLRLWK